MFWKLGANKNDEKQGEVETERGRGIDIRREWHRLGLLIGLDIDFVLVDVVGSHKFR